MPTLKQFMGELDWGEWLYGLIAGFLSGGASSLTAAVGASLLDPAKFNLMSKEFYILGAMMFVANGILGAMLYLRAKPLPDHHKAEVEEATHG